MDSLTVMKKVRKLSRKGKLLSGNSGLDEKQEMLTALMNKTGKSYKVRYCLLVDDGDGVDVDDVLHAGGERCLRDVSL